MPYVLIVGVRDGLTLAGSPDLGSAWYGVESVPGPDAAVVRLLAEGEPVAAVADAAGFAAVAERLRRVVPGLPVVAITSDPAVPVVVDLMRAGASDVLVRPLRALALVTAVSRLFMHEGRPPIDDQDLARRERQVFDLLGEGRANAEIAAHLGLSAKTVDGTLIRLRAKRGCADVSSLRQLAVVRVRRKAAREAVLATIPVMGHAGIDAGHERMLLQLCRLEQVLTGVEGAEAAQRTLAALHGCTHAHDADEMRLMRDSGFPGLEEHRAEHAVLLGQIGQLERQVAGGKRAAVATISAFVLHWLGRHVQEHDRRLVAYLAERGGRPSGGRNQANSA